MTLAGGQAIQLASQPGAPFTSAAVAVDSANVYWALPTSSGSGSIEKVPIGGGTPTVVAANTGGVAQLAVDATSLYWIGGGEMGGAVGPVWKIAK